MTRAETTTPGHAAVWTVVILLLLACRLPSLVEPAGADQSLYAYVGQQINAGHVAYRDAWDQKPPAVHFIYAALWRIWPDDAVVAAADLAAAGLIAWLLVILGSRTLGRDIGLAAAGLFLLLGDPAIQRLSGVRVRSQCETFIALAIVAALVLMTGRRQTRWHALAAGCFFATAFWLKYNAAAYALPIAIAAGLQPRASHVDRPPVSTQLFFIGIGFGAISAGFLVYFAAAGALRDLWLATISYNLQYSSETYNGPGAVAGYVLFPLQRARIDLLWYLGGAGLLTLLVTHDHRARWLAFAWIAAACLSVAINGARDLPQYFIQANPALAFAAAAGLSLLWRAGMRPAVRIAAVAVLLVGLWKVGDEPLAFRLGGLPEAARNTAFDLRYARGAIDRTTVGSSRVDLQACKLEYSIVSPK